LKRLITYLYNYESGTKGKGTGFIRVDQRGREIRMEVHVREAKHMQGKATLYLIAGKDPVEGIYVGDITMVRGEGNESFRFSAFHMFDSGMDFSDVCGVAIQNNEGYLASNWREESCPELLKGTFRVKEHMEVAKTEIEAMAQDVQETQILDESLCKQETSPDTPVIEETSPVETSPVETSSVKTSPAEMNFEEKFSDHREQQVFEKPTYRKIQLSHIRNLPPQNRHLGNNNFLRHGFFNYNYLILKKEITPEGEQWSIGVPGVYEQPEKMMATMFGFLRFEASQEGEGNPEEGTFGAWYTPLQM
jgi:hypothetical protein